MASKQVSSRTVKNKTVSQNNQETKLTIQKHSSKAKQNKESPRRPSPVHKIIKSSREDHRSENNRPASLFYHRHADDLGGHKSPSKRSSATTNRASPVIINDLLHGSEQCRNNSAVNQVVTPSDSLVVSRKGTSSAESSTRHSDCISHRLSSAASISKQLPESYSVVDTGKADSPNATDVESRNDTQDIQLFTDRERDTMENNRYKLGSEHNDDTDTENSFVLDTTDRQSRKNLAEKRICSPSTHCSAVCGSDSLCKGDSAIKRTNAHSKNNSATCKTDTPSRSNSALYRLDTPSRANSALQRFDTPTRNNSTLYRTDAPLRSDSAFYRTEIPSRGNSTSYRTGTPSRNISATYRINSPSTRCSTSYKTHTTSRKQVMFKTNEETKEMNELDTTEIIQGSRIGAPITSEPESLNEAAEDSTRDSTRANRTDISSRGSSLMLGSAKVRNKNDVETLELHFDETDYSHLVTQKSSNTFDINSTTCSNTTEERKLSPRSVEVQMPKTYITRTGSLFLYSDGRIMKDKQERSVNSRENDKNIEVCGRKMAQHTLVPQAYPYWGKLVNKKNSVDNRNNTGCTRKDQQKYIGINSRGSNNNAYSWNYTVLPVKLINADEYIDIKTVNNLSDAVLAYRSKSPTTEDRYLTMMQQTRNGKTQLERMAGKAKQLRRLSTWTNNWLHAHSSATFKDDSIVSNGQRSSESQTAKDLIARYRKSLKLSKFCRAPTNTPLVASKR